MKFSIKLKIFLLSSLAISGMAQESIPQSDLLLPPNPQEIHHKKNYLYGSLSIDPGAGISWRWRNGARGTAADFKIGVLCVIIHAPMLSGDYNFLYYTRKTEDVSPYFSCGIGTVYTLPYIPLRAGIEFKNGFVDIGAKVACVLFDPHYPYVFFPFPEIRFGYSKLF